MPHHSEQGHLKGECLTSCPNNSILDLGRAEEGVAVRNRLQGSRQGSVGSTAEVIVIGYSVAGVSRVEGLLASNKGVGFNQQLSTFAGIHAIGNIEEVAVVDVASAEAERGSARVDVVPVVVVLGDVQVASVLTAVAVRVSDQGSLVVVVDEGVGHSNVVGSMGKLLDVSTSGTLSIYSFGVEHLRQGDHHSNPCCGPCQTRHHSGQSTRWSIFLIGVSFVLSASL